MVEGRPCGHLLLAWGVGCSPLLQTCPVRSQLRGCAELRGSLRAGAGWCLLAPVHLPRPLTFYPLPSLHYFPSFSPKPSTPHVSAGLSLKHLKWWPHLFLSSTPSFQLLPRVSDLSKIFIWAPYFSMETPLIVPQHFQEVSGVAFKASHKLSHRALSFPHLLSRCRTPCFLRFRLL